MRECCHIGSTTGCGHSNSGSNPGILLYISKNPRKECGNLGTKRVFQKVMQYQTLLGGPRIHSLGCISMKNKIKILESAAGFHPTHLTHTNIWKVPKALKALGHIDPIGLSPCHKYFSILDTSFTVMPHILLPESRVVGQQELYDAGVSGQTRVKQLLQPQQL